MELRFWCGHGNRNRLAWGSNGQVTGEQVRDLYYRLSLHTTGSHATVYNAALYGNMYRQTMREWLD